MKRDFRRSSATTFWGCGQHVLQSEQRVIAFERHSGRGVGILAAMTMKATKPTRPRRGVPAVEADERHLGDVDSFIARNRDELNASIRHSRAEVGKGVQSTRTIDDIIADGRRRHSSG